MFLQSYKNPETYNEAFEHNKKQINGIESDELLHGFIEEVSRVSKIDYKIALLELKRYLMTTQEYYPQFLKRNPRQACISFLKIIFKWITSGRFQKKYGEIIIDNWSNGVIGNFYSEQLLRKLGKAPVIENNFSGSSYLRFAVLKKYLIPFVALLPSVRRIFQRHGIDLTHFLYRFFVDFAVGKSLRELGPVKLVISGNDNGFPTIKAKAIGAESILVQNGLRINVSDSSFKYADHYISMGSDEMQKLRKETGCFFIHSYFWGSIRLHHYLNGTNNFENKFDILFTESMYIHTEYGSAYYYRNEDERKIIPLLNAYAKNNKCRIAYKARKKESIDYMRDHGLLSPYIFYTYDQNVYDLIQESSIILSSFSTVCLEAMALNKKAGFVNFSGNHHLNKLFNGLDIELTVNTYESFFNFIENLKSENKKYRQWIIQNPRFIDDLINMAENIVTRNERTPN